MRLLIAVLVTACTHAPGMAPPAPPIASTPHVPDCAEAAAGIERATRGVRAPESTVVRAMHLRCVEDAWSREAMACFSGMNDDELARCARLLPEAPRGELLALLGDGGGREAIEVARVRLGELQVGVDECDRFVAAVSSVLGCEQMPLDTRVQLGNETVDFWNLPTSGLSEDAHHRMAEVCGASLATLQAEASSAGCAL